MGYHKLRELLLKHEGLRLKPYTDTVGKITVGCGRNLTDVGISEEEAFFMLNKDIARVEKEAVENFAWFKFLSATRQDVVISMIFNMGLGGFKQFKNLNEALENQNYSRAADEMLSSKWALQVGLRAQELAQMMRTDSYP